MDKNSLYRHEQIWLEYVFHITSLKTVEGGREA